MKILIVEDDAIYADAIEMMIEKMGYQPIGIAENSHEALRLIKTAQPDLLLLDIRIKGAIDGIQLAEQVPKSIPVIFVTSMQDAQTFERAKKTAPFAYITKPIDPKLLQRSIELALCRYAEQAVTPSPANPWSGNAVLNDGFFVKTGQKLRKILISSIYYVEVDKKHSTIALQNEQLKIRMSLKELAQKLPEHLFIKVHQSCLVNIQKIEDIDISLDKIKLGKYTVSMSRRHKKMVLNELNQL